MKWLPITEAQENGDVVLTDQGTAKYVNQRLWGSPVTDGWYLCTVHGDIPYCYEEGMSISSVCPTLWMPFPSVE